jgi:hypothetical protein
MNDKGKTFKSISLGKKEVRAYLWDIIFYKDQISIEHMLDKQDLVQALKEIAATKPEEEAQMIKEVLEKYFPEAKSLN